MGLLSKLFKSKKKNYIIPKGNYLPDNLTSLATYSDKSFPANPNAYVKIGETANAVSYDIYMKPNKSVDNINVTFKVKEQSTYDIYGNKVGVMNTLGRVDDTITTAEYFPIMNGSFPNEWPSDTHAILNITS